MLNLIFETLWLFLPAIGANMAPVFTARYNWLARLDIPLDGRVMVGGKRIFGDNKTIRGFVVGVLAGAIIAFLQGGSVEFGALMGLGALVGDAVQSFAKRQSNIAPGESWPVFDQIDFVIGAIVFTWPLVSYSMAQIVTAVLILGAGSYVVSQIGVALNIKESL